MGIVIRQSVKSAIATYAGVVIGTINVLWLSTAFLSRDRIGLIRVLLDNAFLFASLAQLGTSHVAVRYFAYFNDESRKYNGFLGFLLLFPLAGFLLYGLAYLLFQPVFARIYRENAPELLGYYFEIVPLVFFVIYIYILEAYARVHLRIVVPAIIREVFLKLANAGLILLFAAGVIDFRQLVLLLIASYGVAVFMLLAYLKNLKRLYLNFSFDFVRSPLFRPMITYGLVVILGGLGSQLASKIDSLMLPAYPGGLDVTGIYAIAFNIGVVIEVPRRALSQIITPLIAMAWRQSDLKEIGKLYHSSALNQLIVGVLLFLGIWCNIDAIYTIMPNGELYEPGKMVVLLIALGRLVDMGTGVNSEIIISSKYYKFDLITAVLLALMMVVINLYFIPWFGINGAALTTLISLVIYNGTKCFFLWWKFRIQPFSAKTVTVLAIAGVAFLAAMLVPYHTGTLSETLISLFFRSLAITVVFAGLVYLLKVSPEANQVAHSLLGRLRNFVRPPGGSRR